MSFIFYLHNLICFVFSSDLQICSSFFFSQTLFKFTKIFQIKVVILFGDLLRKLRRKRFLWFLTSNLQNLIRYVFCLPLGRLFGKREIIFFVSFYPIFSLHITNYHFLVELLFLSDIPICKKQLSHL